MAVYTGKISLINMSEIAAAAVGIQNTKVLYVTSDSGSVPPDLVNTDLITENGIISFASTGASFQIIDNVIWAQQGSQSVPLAIDKDKILVGISSWTPEFPQVKAGEYLWTKTIYYYTNDTQTVIYGVSRQGEQGPMGPAGASASQFKINCSQTEILKFVDSQGTTSISPKKLAVSIIKNIPASENGYIQVDDLDISNFSVEVYNINTGEWNTLIDTEIVQLENNLNFSINLEKLIDQGQNEEDGSIVATWLLFNECILKINYVHYENVDGQRESFNLVDFVNVRYGMNKDMAQLSVKANGIVASMQNSNLVFDASGLMIKNGAFVIKDDNGNNLFYSDNGNLVLKGNIYAEDGYFKGELQGATGTFEGELKAATGSFEGELKAATGSFSGNINANGGAIGGFIIDKTQLISEKTGEDGLPNIILNGTNGIIEAENIVLGTGARIREYIKIGDQVELRRVTTSIDPFIRVFDKSEREILTLRADGSMNIGYGNNSIIISGADGSIVSQNFSDGLGWKISNTESIFNDVTVRGSIRASVLEYGETQAIGGALLVRPSSRIIEAERFGSDTRLTLEQTEGFNIGDYCRIDIQTVNSIEHRFFVISNIVDKVITVSGDATDSRGKPIVSFGQVSEDKNKNNNVGICINGSLDNSFGTPQSISVFDFNPTTQIITPRVVLGKLPNEESVYGYAAGTYGLYAENVLLKGSLVTQTATSGSVTYSGISTLHSGADAPASHRYGSWFGEKNTGEILLWAGATGTSKEEVENSKFFVDRNGNLFAGSGYFKGTIITDATITASAIETAVLRGSNEKPGEPALRIEDAANGICFTTTDDKNNIITVFEVTKDTITANVPNFKFNSNFTIGGNGSLVVPNLYVIGNDAGLIDLENETQALIFDKHRIFYSENFKQNELTGGIKGYIDFASTLSFSPDGVNEVLELSTQEVRAKTSLYIEESIKYNDLMEYRPVYSSENVLIGYDLYVE